MNKNNESKIDGNNNIVIKDINNSVIEINTQDSEEIKKWIKTFNQNLEEQKKLDESKIHLLKENIEKLNGYLPNRGNEFKGIVQYCIDAIGNFFNYFFLILTQPHKNWFENENENEKNKQ